MTKLAQDFNVYSGDDAIPEFTILDGSGAALDISTVTDIIWQAQRDLASAVVLEKTKIAGQVAFSTDGTDGKFKVTILAANSATMTGFYIHQAILVDSGSLRSTVTLGRLQVGRMPVSSYSGDPSLSDKDAVRFLLGDTDSAVFVLTDPAILYLLTVYGNPFLAGAAAARSLAATYAKRVSKRVGPLAISYSDLSRNYFDLADRLQSQGEQIGATIYAGGTSISDMTAVSANKDRVPQPFARGQFNIPNAANPATTDPDNQFNPNP